MIKNCRVLINNEAVTVFEYDGKHVQIPSIHRNATIIKVNQKDNQYIIVDDDYKETITKPQSKRDKKKTTVNKNANKTKNTEDVFEEISE